MKKTFEAPGDAQGLIAQGARSLIASPQPLPLLERGVQANPGPGESVP